MSVYVPNRKIALASSFEGIVNNGTAECALTSLNAYRTMHGDLFYDRAIDPVEFRKERSGDRVVRAFLALRPLVEVAEDYHTVLNIIIENPVETDALLSDLDNQRHYDFFSDGFYERQGLEQEDRARFEEEFYRERTRMQDGDYDAWAATQSVYPNSIRGFRKLVETQKRDGPEILRGFVPWFATSKDEASTYDLCTIYSDLGILGPGDVAESDSGVCVISRDRIIGKETTKNKLEQVRRISEAEGLPQDQVWRVNDRYDPEQQQELADNGFRRQIMVTGGYVFPHDIHRAREDTLLVVVERDNMAEEISRYARGWGF